MAVVLCFHRVAETADFDLGLCCPPSKFAQVLSELRANFEVVSLQALRPEVGNQVAITFDDGYEDNYTNALPVLLEHEVPATFFISTRFVQTGTEFYWDSLVALNASPDYALRDFIRARDEVARRRGPRRWKKIVELAAQARNLGQKSIARPMTVDQLRSLASHSLVTLGSHTATHPSLGSLTLDEQREEVRESSAFLSSLPRRNELSGALAFPFGRPCDCPRSLLSVVASDAVTVGLTTEAAAVGRTTQKDRTPRLVVGDQSVAEVLESIAVVGPSRWSRQREFVARTRSRGALLRLGRLR